MEVFAVFSWCSDKIALLHRSKTFTKFVCLTSLTFLNSCWAISMSYSRTREGDKFISSTAVLMAEVFKMVTSLALVMVTGDSYSESMRSVYENVWRDKMALVKMSVPAVVYLLQNNFLYIAANNLDAATYQVIYQLKILTTALFAIFLLRRVLQRLQLLALLLLFAGVTAVQLAAARTSAATDHRHQNKAAGIAAAVAASCCSGFAGIYLEKNLKDSDISLWMKNVQLSLASLPLGLITAIAYDWDDIMEKGFFFAYDAFTVYLIALNGAGGLLVAIVVKYCDNILKNFASSLAIVISMLVSILFFGFSVNLEYLVGTALVITSVFMYSYGDSDGLRRASTVTL